MDELNNLKEVLFSKFDDAISHLLDVDSKLLLLASVDLLELALLISREGARLTQDLLQRLRGVSELNRVLNLILRRHEVEVVSNGVLATLLSGEHINGHLELAPAFVRALERRLVEHCQRVSFRGWSP